MAKADQKSISRVPDQNGVSLLYIMLEIHHSGWEPSVCSSVDSYKHCIEICMMCSFIFLFICFGFLSQCLGMFDFHEQLSN